MGKKMSKAHKRGILNWVLVVLLLGVIGFGVMEIKGWTHITGLTIGGGGDDAGSGPGAAGGSSDCNSAPSLTKSVRDALQQGTAVTVTTNYMVNDVYIGTTEPSYSVGDRVKLLLNASSWIDVVTDEITMECGANKMTKGGSESILMYDYTAATIEIKDDSTTLTDSASGGANNATNITLAGSDTHTVCFTGTDKDSSGDLLYVVELSSTQNVSNVLMYKLGTEDELATDDVPSFYTNTLSSPYKKAFVVPQVVNAKQMCYSLTMSAKSGKDITGAVYTTAYVGQPFVEDDGSFTAWGVEQKDGDTKYEATFDYDYWITP